MDVVLDPGIWRYPRAGLTTDRRAVTFAGTPAVVLPRGLHREADGADNPVTELRTSAADAFDSFRLLAQLDDNDAPEHLVEHLLTHGGEALCRDHGLPVWHRWPARTLVDAEALPTGVPRPGASCPAAEGLTVDRAVKVARFIDSVVDAAARVRRRQRVSRAVVEDVLALEPMQQHRVLLAELNRDGELSAARGRQLVALAVGSFLENTGTRLGMSWIARHRPELVAKCPDEWGVYAVELAARVASDDVRPTLYTCDVCGNGVQLARRPRELDGVYCRSASCKRERIRRNKARQRAGLTGGGTT